MKAAVLAVALLFPSGALACDALDRFVSKWQMAATDALLSTSDVTTHDAVYVFDMHDRTPPDKRFAVIWYDPKACVVDAEFRDLPGLLNVLDMSVYDRF